MTLLKPLKGVDTETEACLRTWLEQQYDGPVQILFGVASPADPACALVRELIAELRPADAELVVCPEQLGANAKVSTLVHLQARIKHDLVVVSDADVSVPPDLLTNLVGAFSTPQTGLVSCFYKLGQPHTSAMLWEAIAVNADFWSQVLQARMLPGFHFALGAVMAIRRPCLEKMGGFAALLEYLADDYQLGQRIARLGATLELCPVVVECRSAPMDWREVWAHQLRWARTIRVCEPLPFFFSILSNGTLWPLLWVAAHPTLFPAAGALLCLATRIVTARANYRRLTSVPLPLAAGGIVLLRDLLGAVIWLLAFAGQHVTWRGQRYHVLRDGRLLEAGAA